MDVYKFATGYRLHCFNELLTIPLHMDSLGRPKADVNGPGCRKMALNTRTRTTLSNGYTRLNPFYLTICSSFNHINLIKIFASTPMFSYDIWLPQDVVKLIGVRRSVELRHRPNSSSANPKPEERRRARWTVLAAVRCRYTLTLHISHFVRSLIVKNSISF